VGARKARAEREMVEAIEFSQKWGRERKQRDLVRNIFWAGFLLSFPIGILSLACGGLGGGLAAMTTGVIILIIASLCFFGAMKFSG
jgi:hypothetical protein